MYTDYFPINSTELLIFSCEKEAILLDFEEALQRMKTAFSFAHLFPRRIIITIIIIMHTVFETGRDWWQILYQQISRLSHLNVFC